MNKVKLNFWVNFLAFIDFLVCAFSGIILLIFLPEGVRRGGYQSFWGLAKNSWLDIHDFSGVLLIVLVLIHLVLHWNWVKCLLGNLFGKKESCPEGKNEN